MNKLSELIAFFPVFAPNEEGGIIKTKSFIYDHSFSDSNMLAFNLFNKIPSHSGFEFKTIHLKLVIDALVEHGGFEIVRTSSGYDYECSHSVFLVNPKTEMVVVFSHFYETSPDKQPTYEHTDALEDYHELMGTTESEDENSKDSIAFSYISSEENFKFIEHVRTIFPIDPKEDKTQVFLFEKNPQGKMSLVPHKIQKFELNLDEHYNDDFKEADKKIMEWVNDEGEAQINKKLVLLHGIAGAGKTNYVKNLMASCGTKKVIYIPPYYIDALGDPGFFSFIQKYKGSLLLIEDAEKVLISRDQNAGNSGISILLNLTDGILASVLNFKIICTFNTDEKEIDSALKRKGRLFLRYKFDLLSEDKTDDLYYKLYKKKAPEKQMSLAAIFEAEDNGVEPEKKQNKVMGFVPQ